MAEFVFCMAEARVLYSGQGGSIMYGDYWCRFVSVWRRFMAAGDSLPQLTVTYLNRAGTTGLHIKDATSTKTVQILSSLILYIVTVY